MKSIALSFALLMAGLWVSANAQSWQEVSAHALTNAVIVWQIPTDQIPNSLWVYRRLLPHIFPAGIISNAIVLGELQSRGFPPSTTNDFYLTPQMSENWPGVIPVIFEIRPCDAYLYYTIPDYGPISEKETPNDETIMRVARKTAPILGLDPTKLEHGSIYTNSCDTDQTTNNFRGRGVFFPRYLDGISFFSGAADGSGAEGFSMEFGEHGKIQAFSVRWSELEHCKNERTASQDEMTRCIRAHKVIVIPNFRPDDFIWLKNLAAVKKLTIIKVTLYYGEGMFGEVPTNDVPCGFAMPFAQLDAVADFGTSNEPVKLLSTILSSEAQRLLAEAAK